MKGVPVTKSGNYAKHGQTYDQSPNLRFLNIIGYLCKTVMLRFRFETSKHQPNWGTSPHDHRFKWCFTVRKWGKIGPLHGSLRWRKIAGMHWLIFNLDEFYIPIQDPMYIPIVVDFTQLDFEPSNRNMKKYVCYMPVYLHKCTCIYIYVYITIYIYIHYMYVYVG